jgi:hypothetical protein
MRDTFSGLVSAAIPETQFMAVVPSPGNAYMGMAAQRVAGTGTVDVTVEGGFDSDSVVQNDWVVVSPLTIALSTGVLTMKTHSVPTNYYGYYRIKVVVAAAAADVRAWLISVDF